MACSRESSEIIVIFVVLLFISSSFAVVDGEACESGSGGACPNSYDPFLQEFHVHISTHLIVK